MTKNENQNQERKPKVKIIVKSLEGGICKPCEAVKRDAEELQKRYGDALEIELVEVILPTDGDKNDKKMQQYFGKDTEMLAPVIIVESDCKSRNLKGGYAGKDSLKEAIEAVRCDR